MAAPAVVLDSLRAGRADPARISARTRARFAEVVQRARSASPFYRELYGGVPEGASEPGLLPVTDKRMLMERFDEWVTDPRVRLTAVREFMEDSERVGEPYLGEYTVARSSGTSGLLGIVLKDGPERSAQSALRLRALLRWLGPAELVRLARRRAAMATVTATGRHYVGLASVSSSGAQGRTRAISAQASIAEVVRSLNEADPAILSSYATMASLLAAEQEAGRLRIAPLLVTSSAEVLPPDARKRIERAFGAKLGDTYATAECPFVAHSCELGLLHVNEDWVLLEPVDAEDRPVAPGSSSSAVLVSNLANRVQPLLRYRLDDEVALEPGPCRCGSPLRALRVLGREHDSLRVLGQAGEIEITPSVAGTAVGTEGGVVAFQLVQAAPELVLLRLAFGEGADRERGRRECEAALRALLARKGAPNVRVELADEGPQPTAAGKYRKLIPLLSGSRRP